MNWTWVAVWGITGLAMLISTVWVDWFNVNFRWFRFNPGWLAVAWALVTAMKNLYLARQLDMTQRELHDWGDALAHATPDIISQVESGKKVQEIAATIQKERGIPEMVCLKYIWALSRAGKGSQEEKLDDTVDHQTDRDTQKDV